MTETPMPTLRRCGGGFELVLPLRGEMAADGFTDLTVMLAPGDVTPRIIERHATRQ